MPQRRHAHQRKPSSDASGCQYPSVSIAWLSRIDSDRLTARHGPLEGLGPGPHIAATASREPSVQTGRSAPAATAGHADNHGQGGAGGNDKQDGRSGPSVGSFSHPKASTASDGLLRGPHAAVASAPGARDASGRGQQASQQCDGPVTMPCSSALDSSGGKSAPRPRFRVESAGKEGRRPPGMRRATANRSGRAGDRRRRRTKGSNPGAHSRASARLRSSSPRRCSCRTTASGV